MGYISGVLKKAESRAATANATLAPLRPLTVAADEIFDESIPHLVIVDADWLLMLELSRQDHRDDPGWGVTFLECAQHGVNIDRWFPMEHRETAVVKGVRETVRWLLGKVVRASSR